VKDLVIANGSFDIACFYGAGIGIAYNMAGGTGSIDNLWIQNGSFRITGTGTDEGYGAGIGTGLCKGAGSVSRVNRLVIDDGDFALNPNSWGSPIGTGNSDSGSQPSLGQILIGNGTFDLFSANRAACIGIGSVEPKSGCEVGSVTILDGRFQLYAPNVGTGIGIGRLTQDCTATLHNLTIAGGSFNITTLTQGSGIGTGDTYWTSVSRIDNLSILGGDFSIYSGGLGAALGTGAVDQNSESSIGTILVANATFRAHAVNGGAAIGNGRTTERSRARIDNITIVSGQFDLSVSGTGSAAAFGAGLADAGSSSSIGHIAVVGGNLTLSGFAGIGSSESASGSVSSIVIGGDDEVRIRCESLLGQFCLNAPEVTLEGSSSIWIEAGSGRLGTSGSISVSDDPSLLLTYSGASEFEGIVGSPLVHIAEIPTIRSDYVVFVILEISSTNARYERKVELELERAKSFVVSVAKDQQYEIRMSGVPSQSETLMNCNDSTVVDMKDDEVLCHLTPDTTFPYSPMMPVSFSSSRRIFAAMSFLWFLEV
jgi:hypothetical protein